MNTHVPIFRGLDARGGRKLRTDTHTNTRDNYSNPRCAHARRGLIIIMCSITSARGPGHELSGRVPWLNARGLQSKLLITGGDKIGDEEI